MSKAKCCVCDMLFKTKPSRAARIKGQGTCSRKCRGILCKTVYKGGGNPNSRHPIDTTWMKSVDTEEKAYFLGWVASDGHVRKDSIVIEVHDRDSACIGQLAKIANVPVTYRKNRVVIRVYSKDWVSDVCRHLSIFPGKKSDVVRAPRLPKALALAFLRGYFDGDGGILSIEAAAKKSRWPRPVAKIFSNSPQMLGDIREIAESGNVYGSSIEWSGYEALDLLSKLYDNARLYLNRKRDTYFDWSVWSPGICGGKSEADGFVWCKSRKDAVPPQKVRASDVGYDLVLLERVKTIGSTEFFDTGVKVKPPYGYYFDLVPRSSLSKTGYILSNSVGIIDPTYVGSIIVPLTKIDPSSPELELPARLVQLIPRRAVHLPIKEVEELGSTERGAGGFGSTGK